MVSRTKLCGIVIGCLICSIALAQQATKVTYWYGKDSIRLSSHLGCLTSFVARFRGQDTDLLRSTKSPVCNVMIDNVQLVTVGSVDFLQNTGKLHRAIYVPYYEDQANDSAPIAGHYIFNIRPNGEVKVEKRAGTACP